MCGAAAIPIAMMAVSAVQSFTRTQGEEANAQYERQVAKSNAKQLEYQARMKDYETKQAEYDAAIEKRKNDRNLAQKEGQLRLIAGASGVAGNSGSALDVLLDNTMNTAEDNFALQRQLQKRTNSLAYEKQNLLAESKAVHSFGKDHRSFLQKADPYLSMGKSMIQQSGRQ